ncbi:MAG: hypothetical protein WA453_09425, partial [Methyloceanibacter sp.]
GDLCEIARNQALMADEIPDRVLELWRECQTELAKHGITDHAMRLELEVWDAMRLAPGVDTLPEEKIHRLAYDTTRPDRLSRWDW